ncbi:hypothetical protein HDV05_004698 [Chytridiales sp. JEL 0842]|nr:hypothetical protein HDV05_004698 [Chytridiales sp. JEL 0842]
MGSICKTDLVMNSDKKLEAGDSTLGRSSNTTRQTLTAEEPEGTAQKTGLSSTALWVFEQKMLRKGIEKLKQYIHPTTSSSVNQAGGCPADNDAERPAGSPMSISDLNCELANTTPHSKNASRRSSSKRSKKNGSTLDEIGNTGAGSTEPPVGFGKVSKWNPVFIFTKLFKA